MANNIFEDLARQIQALPDQIKNEYKKITVKTVDDYFSTFERNLRETSGNLELNRNIIVDSPHSPIGDKYIRTLDWDDNTIVNEAQGKRWGTYRNRTRARGKRNYSIVPATYHDLAYIINYGYVDSITGDLIAGNHFIDRAVRKLKKWKSKRDREFDLFISRIRRR